LSSTDPNLQEHPNSLLAEGRRIRQPLYPRNRLQKLIAAEFTHKSNCAHGAFVARQGYRTPSPKDADVSKAILRQKSLKSGLEKSHRATPPAKASSTISALTTCICPPSGSSRSSFALVAQTSQAVHKTLLRALPGVQQYMETHARQWRGREKRLCGKPSYGRRLYLPDHQSQQRHDAPSPLHRTVRSNAPMQGSAADIIKRADDQHVTTG